MIRGAGKEHGIEVGEIPFDFKKVIARSRAAAEKLSKGVRFLFKKNKIDFFEAEATITGPHTVALTQAEDKPAPPVASLEGERILVAAGSGEKLFRGMKLGDGVITSKEALVLDDVAGERRGDRRRRDRPRVRVLLPGLRRQGHHHRTRKADAARHSTPR